MCECMYVGFIHVCVDACEGQMPMSDVFLNHSSSLCFDLIYYLFCVRVSQWTSSPLVKFQKFSCLCFLSAKITAHTSVPGFLHGHQRSKVWSLCFLWQTLHRPRHCAPPEQYHYEKKMWGRKWTGFTSPVPWCLECSCDPYIPPGSVGLQSRREDQ